jgi:hypothetical protein
LEFLIIVSVASGSDGITELDKMLISGVDERLCTPPIEDDLLGSLLQVGKRLLGADHRFLARLGVAGRGFSESPCLLQGSWNRQVGRTRGRVVGDANASPANFRAQVLNGEVSQILSDQPASRCKPFLGLFMLARLGPGLGQVGNAEGTSEPADLAFSFQHRLGELGCVASGRNGDRRDISNSQKDGRNASEFLDRACGERALLAIDA